jgi:hypothetical protein
VAKDEDKKHEEHDDKEGEEDSVREGGKGGFKLDEAKTRATKSLDKDKGQDRQYNYAQAKSTIHSGIMI